MLIVEDKGRREKMVIFLNFKLLPFAVFTSGNLNCLDTALISIAVVHVCRREVVLIN